MTSSLAQNPNQRNYGVAVADLNRNGKFAFIVAGFGAPNLVLEFDPGRQKYVDKASAVIADPRRLAIGVAACDIDGDGREELYVLNTDTFSGRKKVGDRLFSWKNGAWVDLLSNPSNQQAANYTAGRSVACVDRFGQGRYGFFVANYGGPMRLIERTAQGKLANVAAKAGVNLTTGGRGVVSLPLFGPHMDIFTVNENGPNFFFRNQSNGTFVEIASKVGVSDRYRHGRGVTALDANSDGRLDLAYGNWRGPHRLLLRLKDGSFRNSTPTKMAIPSKVRTVIAADFDNDGVEELFFNNIGEPNRLFTRVKGKWVQIPLSAALEPTGLGTGAAVADLNGNGRLELLIAHGESGSQPLTLYETPANRNHWIRIQPQTAAGAPARGAIVELWSNQKKQIRVIDAGSGYLCQMEPVAHFGLGKVTAVQKVVIRWPGGRTRTLQNPAIRKTHIVR